MITKDDFNKEDLVGAVKFDNPFARIMVAIDVDSLEAAEKIVDEFEGTGTSLKFGLQLGSYEGWADTVKFARDRGVNVFLDTKIKDIAKTVGQGCRSITRHQPDFFNIMGDVQRGNFEKAVEGVDSAVSDYDLGIRPKLLAVTVLTDISDDECMEIYGKDRATAVQFFASQAATGGVDGLVCSPKEVAMLRTNDVTKDLIYVTPGIRPSWASADGQSAFTTPAEAVLAGSDYLVIGSPITKPPAEIGGPRQALESIVEEIKAVEEQQQS